MDAVSHHRFLRDPDIRLADARRGGKGAAFEGYGGRKSGAGVGLAAAVAAAVAGGGVGASALKSLSKGGSGGGSGGERGAAASAGGGGEGWAQCPWLRSMGGFRLAAFLANR